MARQGFLFLLARNCRMLPSKASKASNPSKASKRAKPALGAAKRRTLNRAKPALGVSRTGSCGKRSGPFSSAKPSGCGTPRLSFSTGPKLPDAPFSFKSLKPFKSLETCQTGSWSCETTDLEPCQTGSWSKPNWKLWQAKCQTQRLWHAKAFFFYWPETAGCSLQKLQKPQKPQTLQKPRNVPNRLLELP